MALRHKWWWFALVFLALLILAVLVAPMTFSAEKNETMAACVEQVRDGLRPLDLSRPQSPTEAEADFLAFYGLDVAGAQPWVGTRKLAGQDVAVHVFGPEQARATVLICHGYYDHSGVWRRVIPVLTVAHYRVVIYDQPGHGLSDGDRASIDDFQTYVEVLDGMVSFVADRFPGDPHIVAHSMGAGVVADWILQGHGEDVRQVVLLAPLFHSTAWGVSRLGHNVIGRWFTSMPRKYRKNSGDAEFLAFSKADPLQHGRVPSSWVAALGRWNRDIEGRAPSDRDVTVIQGDQDTTVDWKYNSRLMRRLFPQARIEMVAGGQHQLMNDTPRLRERTIQFIQDALGQAQP
jgi:alpha-beta hydrolase superfamily lysophospholipase